MCVTLLKQNHMKKTDCIERQKIFIACHFHFSFPERRKEVSQILQTVHQCLHFMMITLSHNFRLVRLRKEVVEGFMPRVVGTSKLVISHWVYSLNHKRHPFQRDLNVMKYTISVCHIIVQINYIDFIGKYVQVCLILKYNR